MSELIKREDAIEAIQNTFCKPCKEQGNDYNEAKCRACNFDDAILEIKDVPSAEAIPCEIADKVGEENERLTDRIGQLEEQMRWIPCSELLPNEKEKVLCQFTEWDTGEINMDVAYLTDWNLWVSRWFHKRYNPECVAWMPLPQPYKGGDDK